MDSASKRDPVRLGSLRIRCLDCEDCLMCNGDGCSECDETGCAPCMECEDRESEIQHEATRFRDRDAGRGIEGPDRVYVECARRYLEEDYLIP